MLIQAIQAVGVNKMLGRSGFEAKLGEREHEAGVGGHTLTPSFPTRKTGRSFPVVKMFCPSSACSFLFRSQLCFTCCRGQEGRTRDKAGENTEDGLDVFSVLEERHSPSA